MENQFTGRAGESRFKTLCSDNFVTCNKSDEDDHGWDMYLEFPRRPQPLVALDMQEEILRALVQVKATRSGALAVQLRLSNILNYVQSSLPTFIVLVVIEDGVDRYFAKHVWPPLLGDWLKAAREADAKGVTAANQHLVTLRFDDEDERGALVLDWMQDQIRAVAKPYAATKLRISVQ